MATVEGSELSIILAVSANQNVTKKIQRAKPEEWPPRSGHGLTFSTRTKKLADSQQNLRNNKWCLIFAPELREKSIGLSGLQTQIIVIPPLNTVYMTVKLKYCSVQFSSVPGSIGSSGVHEGRFNRDPLPFFFLSIFWQ